eukprot:CAMPEP_0172774302 /NCGR_PEP_ID=MMETSP1074-20121228/195889_1 /TAXON_ID=2916 /ORGANISM="Ceratium fusus, Strain PA161109" /LENGTH=90 /DNA_ID=CAMNT_0013610713 /DNA_START=215 /DNA_END=485 /DNA_ORIENTATION=+
MTSASQNAPEKRREWPEKERQGRWLTRLAKLDHKAGNRPEETRVIKETCAGKLSETSRPNGRPGLVYPHIKVPQPSSRVYVKANTEVGVR